MSAIFIFEVWIPRWIYSMNKIHLGICAPSMKLYIFYLPYCYMNWSHEDTLHLTFIQNRINVHLIFHPISWMEMTSMLYLWWSSIGIINILFWTFMINVIQIFNYLNFKHIFFIFIIGDHFHQFQTFSHWQLYYWQITFWWL